MKEANDHFPSYGANKFVCPTCMVYSQQKWYEIQKNDDMGNELILTEDLRTRGRVPAYASPNKEAGVIHAIPQFRTDNITALSVCISCDQPAYWIGGELVYPKNPTVKPPNSDMPEEVKKLYNEAREISVLSPRASAALLRLALEKLLPLLGAQGKRINDMIGDLVKKGLSPKIQQALDSLRVIGNEAVHPGSIDLDEEKEVALALFKLINLVVEQMITESDEIDEIYSLIPKDKRDGIQDRDQMKTTK
ncbi:DUF4145 domain-containing protein [Bacillus safensis]|uniref:DUF4145 domain-containing protein n=1 Tax=Bacillus safensis TaxID=561879 RepID=UPI002E1AA211|nr:DUF4145 domain-containing protein [Bacillus safensis]